MGFRSDQLVHFGAVLERYKGGHGSDSGFVCCVWHFFHIQFVELGTLDVLGEMLESGRGGLAGATPIGAEIEDARSVFVDDLLEFLEPVAG